mgnify:FL=1
MKRLVIEMEDELHKNVKIKAASEEMPMKDYVKRLIANDLQKEKEQTR